MDTSAALYIYIYYRYNVRSGRSVAGQVTSVLTWSCATADLDPASAGAPSWRPDDPNGIIVLGAFFFLNNSCLKALSGRKKAGGSRPLGDRFPKGGIFPETAV
jgi:hypothetical protein